MQARSELAEALRSKGQLQIRVKNAEEELEKLRVKSTAEGRRLAELTTERAILATKVKDRDEELKGKAKLLEVRTLMWWSLVPWLMIIYC